MEANHSWVDSIKEKIIKYKQKIEKLEEYLEIFENSDFTETRIESLLSCNDLNEYDYQIIASYMNMECENKESYAFEEWDSTDLCLKNKYYCYHWYKDCFLCRSCKNILKRLEKE